MSQSRDDMIQSIVLPVLQEYRQKDSCSACADNAVIAAKAHIHMTKQDAQDYGVVDGQIVRVKLKSPRPITLEDVVVRVKESFQLAMHIDTDEANAAQMPSDGKGEIC